MAAAVLNIVAALMAILILSPCAARTRIGPRPLMPRRKLATR